MMKNTFLYLVLISLLTACGGASNTPSAVEVVLGDELMNETFDEIGDWDTQEQDGYSLNVESGEYVAALNWRGRYITGANNEVHDNVVMEADVTIGADDRLTETGITCRASPQNPANGYHFLINPKGEFSIRRGMESSADGLVAWEENEAVLVDGATNHLRADCVGNLLQFFINDTFVASVRDETHHRGYASVIVSQPANASGTSDVRVDNFKIWSATLP